MADAVTMHISRLNEQPWGAYLILADEGDVWHLPVGLRPATAAAVKAQLAGRGDATVPALIESLLGFVQGRLARVEIATDEERGWIQGGAVVLHDGTERTLPIRIHDGALLARHEGVPLVATTAALRRAGIRKDETLDRLDPADQDNLKRYIMGCLALERLDEGIAACKRFLVDVNPDSRDIWRTWLGDFYRLKGWWRRAVEEYAAGLAWEVHVGDYTGVIRIAEKIASVGTVEVAARRVHAPALIEDFGSDDLSNTLSASTWGRNLPAPGRPAGSVRQFDYDLKSYAYPWLHVGFPGTEIWEGAAQVTFEVHFAPATGPKDLALEFGMDVGGALDGKYVAPPVTLSPGWTRHVVSLRDPVWKVGDRKEVALTADPLEPVVGVQFGLQGGGKQGTGTISFANIRIE